MSEDDSKIEFPTTQSQVEGTYERKKPDGWLPRHLQKISMPETAIKQMRAQLREMKRQMKKYEDKDRMAWSRRKGVLQRINECKRKHEGFRLHAIALLNSEALPEQSPMQEPNNESN